jgi:hypothetical protein
MDVKFEGANVDRHIDPTTSNHASMIGNVMAPMVNLAVMAMAWFRRVRGKCECCGKDPHSPGGTSVSMDDWYTQNNQGNPDPRLKNGWTQKDGTSVRGYDAVIADARNRKNLTPPCTCNGKLLPEPPCNKFHQKTSQTERNAIKQTWRDASRKGDGPFTIRRRIGAKAGDEVMHLTPKGAGGCPTGKGNLQVKKAPALCSVCQNLDTEFSKLQGAPFRF